MRPTCILRDQESMTTWCDKLASGGRPVYLDARDALRCMQKPCLCPDCVAALVEHLQSHVYEPPASQQPLFPDLPAPEPVEPPEDVTRLWYVTVTYDAFVLADTEMDAEHFSYEIVDVENSPLVEASLVRSDSSKGAWEDACLVYHEGSESIRLGDVWPEDDR